MSDLHDHVAVVVTRDGWISMQTPESKEKNLVKDFLHERRVQSLTKPIDKAIGFYWMPVPGGYGTSLLDFVICYRGVFIAVETKRLGDKPTPRQKVIIDMIVQGSGLVIWGTAREIIEGLTDAFHQLDEHQYAIDP